MQYIGFTNKFYTLWEVYEDSKPLGNGRTMKVTKHIYIKNISFDRNTAFATYPNAKFDEELRGHSASFDSNERIEWDNVDTFRFGKYQYMKIKDNSDTDYIEWYWNQVYAEHREYVAEVLKSRGYEVRYWVSTDENGQKLAHQYLMSPESIAQEKFEEFELNKKVEELTKGESLNVFITSNLDEDGYYKDGNISYHFQEVKENWYAGFYYYLPVLKGKAKRIKNKNIIIKNYTWKKENNSVVIEVIDFEIKK